MIHCTPKWSRHDGLKWEWNMCVDWAVGGGGSGDGWRSSFKCCLPGWRRGSKLSLQLARHCCSALAALDTPPTQQIAPTTAYLLCTLGLFALCWAHRNYTEIDRYNGGHQTSLPLSIFTRWMAHTAHSYSGLRSRHDSAPAAAFTMNSFAVWFILNMQVIVR